MLFVGVYESIKGPKLRELHKRLKCSRYEATGILVFFWLWAMKGNSDSDGYLINVDRDDLIDFFISENYGCQIPPEEILDTLIETNWLEVVDGKFLIHDWGIWQKNWYKYQEKLEKNAERTREYRRRKKEEEEAETPTPPQIPEDSEKSDESPKDQPKKEKSKPEYSVGFLDFWEAYPRQIDKGNAYIKYKARIKDGFSDEELIEAAKAYAKECKELKTEDKFIKHPKTFLSEKMPFTDYIKKKEVALAEKDVIDTSNPFKEYLESINEKDDDIPF